MTKKLERIVRNKANAVSLELRDLASIIKSCKKNGVRHLKWRDLELSFEGQIPLEAPITTADTTIPILEPTNDEMNPFEVDDLKITDPLAYEQLVGSGEYRDSEN